MNDIPRFRVISGDCDGTVCLWELGEACNPAKRLLGLGRPIHSQSDASDEEFNDELPGTYVGGSGVIGGRYGKRKRLDSHFARGDLDHSVAPPLFERQSPLDAAPRLDAMFRGKGHDKDVSAVCFMPIPS